MEEEENFFDFDNIALNKQNHTLLHPIISNTMFARENKLVEHERLETIFKLSRMFQNEDMHRIVNQLEYKLK